MLDWGEVDRALQATLVVLLQFNCMQIQEDVCLLPPREEDLATIYGLELQS